MSKQQKGRHEASKARKSDDELDLAKAMLARFRGRDDVVAVATNQGFEPETLPAGLSPGRFAADHIRQRRCLALYLMRRDNTVLCSCLDFDNKAGRPDPEWRTKACEVSRFLIEHGLRTLIEISQSGAAAHVWIFFSDPVPAKLVREFWSAVLAELKMPQPEVYPRQDQVKNLGNPIRFPLFNKSRFIDMTGTAIEPRRALAKIKETSASQLEAFVREFGGKRAGQSTALRSGGLAGVGQLPARVQMLLNDETSNLGRRWRGDTTDMQDKSRSALVFAIACCLIHAFVPPEHIGTALSVWCEVNEYEKGRRSDWIELTIQSAYDSAAKAYDERRSRHDLLGGASAATRREFKNVISKRIKKTRSTW